MYSFLEVEEENSLSYPKMQRCVLFRISTDFKEGKMSTSIEMQTGKTFKSAKLPYTVYCLATNGTSFNPSER